MCPFRTPRGCSKVGDSSCKTLGGMNSGDDPVTVTVSASNNKMEEEVSRTEPRLDPPRGV